MNPKLIPGNSSYSEIVKKGQKVLILGDSIPSRIEMREFNHCLKERMNSHSIRKSFPGATPLELAHYCIPTLIKEMPDAVIIHVGINCIKSENPSEIQQDILKIVEICQSYGVTDVFVSAVTIMDSFMTEINSLNNLLISSQFIYNFRYICNANIGRFDLWRDRIHLNNGGIKKLANNFINAIRHTSFS